MKKKMLSGFIAVCMVLTMLPIQVFASTEDVFDIDTSSLANSIIPNMCESHAVHDDDCGYIEAINGADCTHECELCKPVEKSDCTCPPVDSGEITHGESCPLYEVPAVTVPAVTVQSDAVKNVIEHINALPTIDELETQNTNDAEFPLATLRIDTATARVAFDALTAEEKAAFDSAVLEKLTALEDILATMPVLMATPESKITIKINNDDTSYGGANLNAAVDLAKKTAEYSTITTLTIMTGEVTTADWKWFKGTTEPVLTALTDFTVETGVAVANIPDSPSNTGVESPRSTFPLSIKNVSIPQITTIGSFAFNLCSVLETANFPNVTTIGEYAFNHCKALETADFPNVTTIEEGAFNYCSALKDVSFTNVTTLNNYIFISCTSLESATFPNVITIGKYVFSTCTSLKTVSFPKVKTIGVGAFIKCTSLESVSLPNVTTIGEHVFSTCTSLKTVSFPNVTSIEYLVFEGCTSLETVSFPSVREISTSAFKNCTTLETLTFPKLTKIHVNAFDGCSKLTTLKLPAKPPTITLVGNNYTFINCSTLLYLEFVDANGTALVSAGSKIAWTAYKAVRDNSTTDEFWCGLTIAHIPVTNITGITTAVTADTSLTLTGIVEPASATNTTIIWTVKDAGDTGAKITNGTLTTTAAGTVTITATITNGIAANTNYTQDFTITTSASPDAVAVAAAMAAIVDGTVNVAFGADQSAKTAAVQAYVNTKLTGASDVTATVTHKKDNIYTVALNKGSENDIKDITMTIIEAPKPAYTGTEATAPTNATSTATAITLTAVTVDSETVEYAKNTSTAHPTTGWQDNASFTGLTPDTQYYFFARVKESATHNAGATSTGTAIKTDKSDIQKVAAAKILTEAALAKTTATNETTAAEVLNAVNTAITGTGVTAAWDEAFSKTNATESAAGSVTGTIKLTCNGASDTVLVELVIARIISDTEKVGNVTTTINVALGNYTATNATTDTDIMTLVSNEIGSTGITAKWKTGNEFSKTDATDDAAGSVTGTITLTLNGETQDIAISFVIAQLTADKTALTTAITAANNVKATATVNNNIESSVASGTRFVTTAVMKAFADAIAAAQVIENSTSINTAQVNAAVSALNKAAGIFTAAIKIGTYISSSSTSSSSSDSVYTGGYSGSWYSGSDSTGSTTTPPTINSTEPVTGSTNINATVDNNGNTNVNITNKQISDAVKAAQNATTQNGITAGEMTVAINVISPANSNPNTVSISMAKNVQEQIISDKIDNLIIVIDKPNISISMNLAAITEMNRQANTDIQLSVSAIDATKLSTEAKNIIGSRPAFDLKATYANGSRSISNFGSGTVSVTIPYNIQNGEIIGSLYATYVDGNGDVSYLTTSSYDVENKVLRFRTNHFSVYGIGYKTPIGFTDTTNHWAKNDIEFVANRNLINGTSNTTFSPNDSMTRGMFVTALGKLADVDVNSYKTAKFSDVNTDSYYAPYVNWAAEKGIVKGATETTFAPDQAITRQEMVTIMSSYAKALNHQLPETRAAVTFDDSGSIASWADSAVKQMQMLGILNGKDGNKFDPTGASTRGEISAMLRRYVELIIDHTTTEGWTTNDSGSSLYYQSGKAVAGTQTISNVAYTFNGYGETTRKTANATTNPATPPVGNKKYTTYTVQKGDSFWRIANKIGCTIAELEQLNSKSRKEIIHMGQVLNVPQK